MIDNQPSRWMIKMTSRTMPRVSLCVPIIVGLWLGGCSGSKLSRWGASNGVSPQAGPQGSAGPTNAESPSDQVADGAPSLPQDQEPQQDTTVLIINEDSLTVEDILAPLRPELLAKAKSMAPARYRDFLLARVQERVRTQARDLLLYQEASRRLGEAQHKQLESFVDQRIRDIVQEEYSGRQVRWELAMAEQGYSIEQARDNVRRELLIIMHLRQTISPLIQEPTRRELMRYYDQRKEELTTPERREMLLIELRKEGNQQQARDLAEAALAELNQGADFADTARKHSQGLHAADGGSWGFIEPSSIHGRWAKAAQVLGELPKGGTSPIIETEHSLFIVRVGDIEPRQEPDFTQMQQGLMKSYRDQQFNILVEETVGRLQDSATIRPKNLNLFLQAVIDASPRPG